MAKYKYLRGGRVFESDKKYNLPMIGSDGKLQTPVKDVKTKVASLKKTITPPSITPLPVQPWDDPNRRWFGGDTALGKGEDLYITDAGNLAPRPIMPKKNPLLQQPLIKQDATQVAKPVFDNGGFLKGLFSKKSKRGGPRYNGNEGYEAPELPTQGTVNGPKTDSYGNFMSNAAQWAPFVDNFANLAVAMNTPKLPNPIQTPPPRLAGKLNINPQLRKIENDVRATNIGLSKSTSNTGAANANKGKVLANKFRAIGDLEAYRQNYDTEQSNRAALATYEGNLRNNALLNQTNFNNAIRQDDINQRYASVVSDLGTDISNINRERNMMQLDRERMQMFSKINPDSAYQFTDTPAFKELYKNDEQGLRNLIMKQKGSVPRAKLAALYKQLFGKDI